MKREELYMLETYKVEELKKRLKPITDWNKVKEGQLIFHDTDNNIYNLNRFDSLNESKTIISYKNKNDEYYTMSTSGWYYYDEFIADEVNEYFTPKLYVINDIYHEEDYWFVVACNEKHLKECFVKDNRLDEITDEEFWNKYEYDVLKEINGFEITLK